MAGGGKEANFVRRYSGRRGRAAGIEKSVQQGYTNQGYDDGRGK